MDIADNAEGIHVVAKPIGPLCDEEPGLPVIRRSKGWTGVHGCLRVTGECLSRMCQVGCLASMAAPATL